MYQRDRKWSDRFLNEVKQILQENAVHIVKVEIADDFADQARATDVVVTVTGGNVAVRVRRDSTRFRDLTIRSRRGSGAKTELRKIRDGFGDWYLYGWVNGTNEITEWILVNLDCLRESGILNKKRKEISNADGMSWFVAIPLNELKTHGCVVAEKLHK